MLIAAASAALMWLPVSTSARVLGEDERRAPGRDEMELVRATGLVFCTRDVDGRRRIGAGTATLVGSRSTILTAAHIFEDAAGRQGPRVDFDPVADCRFRQYDTAGELVVEHGFTHARMGAWRRGGRDPNQDWAVLRTEVPLPQASEPLLFALNPAGSGRMEGADILMLAFHRDIRSRNRLPMLSVGTLFDVNYGGFPRLAHTADMERMSSGAAIVARARDGTHVVVGINRSAANLGEFNLAVPLSHELIEALRSFAFGQVPVRGQRQARRNTVEPRAFSRSAG